MEKIDYMKQLNHLYAPSAKKVELVDVPKMNFLMIDGEGNPNTSQAFKDAVEALFSLSYTLKFMIKKGEMGVDYGVLPLQALWWSDDPSAFSTGNKDVWKWTVMVMQPDFVTPALVDVATKEVQRKKKLASLSLARFQAFKEGKAAQILHIGPFTEEGSTIEKVHSFIENSGSEKVGKHHEIYLVPDRKNQFSKIRTSFYDDKPYKISIQ